jgi:hypothetical protein
MQLIDPTTRPTDLGSRRQRFRTIPIGQVFYADRCWWKKRTTRTAEPADRIDDKAGWFDGKKWCWVPAEEARPARSISFEEFMRQSAL